MADQLLLKLTGSSSAEPVRAKRAYREMGEDASAETATVPIAVSAEVLRARRERERLLQQKG